MQTRLRTSVVTSALLLLAATGVPAGSAGSPEAPEMPDKTGDVDPLSLAGLKPEELEQLQGNASMFDIRHAYVTSENKVGFWFTVAVVDLDGGLEPPSPDPVPVPVAGPPMVAQFDVHFQAGGEAWVARATLEPWTYVDESQTPPVVAPPMFLTNFTLHNDDAEATYVAQLAGLVSPQFESIFLYVPKAAVGAPAADGTMDGLYAVSSFDGGALDHAPDARLDPTAADPDDPLAGLLVPQTGTAYAFGQYPGSGAPAKLELSAEGDTTVKSDGDPVDLALSLKNLGDEALDVRVGTTTPRGWSVTLDPETVTLQPGSSNAILVTATPSSTAGAQGVLKITASTQYETQTVVYVLQNAAATNGGSGGGSGSGSPGTTGGPGGDASPDQSLDGSESAESPAPALFLSLVAVIGLLAVLRRRNGR